MSPYNVLYRAGLYLFFISCVALARSRRLLYITLKGDRLARNDDQQGRHGNPNLSDVSRQTQ